MQLVLGSERQQNVAKRSRRQDVSQVSPGERSHVAGEESQQEKDTKRDRGVQDGQDDMRNVPQGDVTHLLHAAGKQGIAHRREDSYAGQD